MNIDVIQQYRRSAGLTWRELEAESGVPIRTIYRWGEGADASLSKFCQVAEAMGVYPGTLLEEARNG